MDPRLRDLARVTARAGREGGHTLAEVVHELAEAWGKEAIPMTSDQEAT